MCVIQHADIAKCRIQLLRRKAACFTNQFGGGLGRSRPLRYGCSDLKLLLGGVNQWRLVRRAAGGSSAGPSTLPRWLWPASLDSAATHTPVRSAFWALTAHGHCKALTQWPYARKSPATESSTLRRPRPF